MTQQMIKLSRWICLECHYIYDPAKGDKKGDPTGVPFEDIPDTWRCPGVVSLKARKACSGNSMIKMLMSAHFFVPGNQICHTEEGDGETRNKSL